MPLGTYLYKPKNLNSIQQSDCEEFIFALLKDVCGESDNILLQKAVVNYGNDYNLGDLNNEDEDIDLLVVFSFDKQDIRNSNFTASTNDDGRNIQIVYDIGMVAKKDYISSIDFLKAFEEVINALTNNWNSINGFSSPYTLTLSNGKTLSTNLSTNRSDTFSEIRISEEDSNQQNYLTAKNKIVLVIVNNT